MVNPEPSDCSLRFETFATLKVAFRPLLFFFDSSSINLFLFLFDPMRLSSWPLLEQNVWTSSCATLSCSSFKDPWWTGRIGPESTLPFLEKLAELKPLCLSKAGPSGLSTLIRGTIVLGWSRFEGPSNPIPTASEGSFASKPGTHFERTQDTFEVPAIAVMLSSCLGRFEERSTHDLVRKLISLWMRILSA